MPTGSEVREVAKTNKVVVWIVSADGPEKLLVKLRNQNVGLKCKKWNTIVFRSNGDGVIIVLCIENKSSNTGAAEVTLVCLS